ncbi:amidohydrolase [Streptomyces sp. NPDC051572]|uniref:amidohydrolase n=1 Tax=Streptomyces sp. NPDC051572 TaxID=3155802 RepID=UPI00344FE1BE
MSVTRTDTGMEADTDTVTWNDKALDEIVSNDTGRPVLFTNARVLTMDPLIGTLRGADVLLVGALLVGVGPGIVAAAGDDNAIVVDCTGMTVVPAVVDAIALVGGRGRRSECVATLTPGNTGDLLVVPDSSAPDVASALATLLTRPEEVRALIAAGEPVLWSGTDAPGRATAPELGILAAQDLTGSPRIGVWIDENDFLHQELTPDGR